MVYRGILNNPTYIRNQLDQKNEVWMVKERGDEIVGVAALAISEPVGLGEIERVCVSKEHRGNGDAYDICAALLEEAKQRDLGFVEAFARGPQIGMQKTFEKLDFDVYGVSPRFEVVRDEKIIREDFVHMGIELKPETCDGWCEMIDDANNIMSAILKNKDRKLPPDTSFWLP
jgi:N-acetylglutamate synthase-like GNAT family acetyltransferase